MLDTDVAIRDNTCVAKSINYIIIKVDS